MSLILDGTNGLSDVDGSAATPAIRGSDANTGVFFGTDIVGVSTGGSERVRVDASGNVGIGTNAPGGRLGISGSVANDLTTFSTADAATTVLNNANGVATGRATKVLFRNSGLNLAGIAGVYTGFNGAGDLAGALAFGTQTNVAGGVVERMRITSAGNVGIGTSSPGGALTVVRATTADIQLTAGATGSTEFVQSGGNGVARHVFAAGGQTAYVNSFDINQSVGGQANIENRANSPITFLTNSTERARINSSGDLLVGTTAANGKLAVEGNIYINYPSAGSGLIVRNDSGGSGQGGQIVQTNTYAGVPTPNKFTRVGDTGQLEWINSGYSAAIMFVTDAGAASQGNNSATWTVVSDIRIKTNVREVGDALGKLMALKPRHFDYKNAIGETQTGFIAQDFETVFPGHVKESSVPMQFEAYLDGEKTIKSVDANLVPYLVKAIQEQQAIITALTARVEALEGAQA